MTKTYPSEHLGKASILHAVNEITCKQSQLFCLVIILLRLEKIAKILGMYYFRFYLLLDADFFHPSNKQGVCSLANVVEVDTDALSAIKLGSVRKLAKVHGYSSWVCFLWGRTFDTVPMFLLLQTSLSKKMQVVIKSLS